MVSFGRMFFRTIDMIENCLDTACNHIFHIIGGMALLGLIFGLSYIK